MRLRSKLPSFMGMFAFVFWSAPRAAGVSCEWKPEPLHLPSEEPVILSSPLGSPLALTADMSGIRS